MPSAPIGRQYERLPRLFLAVSLAPQTLVELGRSQSSYLANVLRRKSGDEVVLFNGRDGAWRARIAGIERKTVTLECIECFAPQPPRGDLWYGFAPLRTGRLDYMVQKATEMGVSMMQPVITRFTQNRRVRLEKMRANVIEAAEQCEVLNVPDVLEPIDLDQLLQDWPRQHGDRALVFADERAGPGSPLETLGALAARPLGLLVGPEGGFSGEERDRLVALDFVFPVSLGPRILRADTAAVAALALIQSTIGDWPDHR